MIKVSVVVAVYNTGRYVEECAPSLLRQSLGADEYEVIYVDDGSTDDTLERLEKLAAEHAHVRVFTQPNSGWPGKPRNTGMSHARGEYIQFVDHDDLLGHESLERLYEHASRNRSDVVIGKMSSTMVRPRRIFRHTIDATTVEHDELMQTMSPHKMFRRAFVEEHGLRFPEGPWILEDLLFVSAAYLAAERISILGDYPCYYWMKRDDGGNNTRHRFDLRHGFFDNVRTIVRQIKDGTEPGDLQDRLLYRLYHVEILSRTREPEILGVPEEEQRPRFDEARRVAIEEFPPGVRDRLPAVSGLRAALLERGDFAAARELAARVKEITVRPEVGGLRWDGGVLTADVRLAAYRGDGEPLVLVEREGKQLLDPALLDGVPGVAEWEVRDPFAYAYADLVVKDRDREDWWYPEGDLDVRLEPLGGGRSQLVATGRLRLDPATLAGGRPLERGVHDVWAYVQMLGVDRHVRMTVDGEAGTTAVAGPALVGTPGRIAIPYVTGSGQLALDLEERQRRLPDDLGAAVNTHRSARRGRPAEPAELPLTGLVAADGARLPVKVRIGEGKQAVTVAAEIVGGEIPVLRVPSRVKAPAGRHPVTLRTPAGERPKAGPVAVAVIHDGHLTRLEGPAHEPSPTERLTDAVTANGQIRRVRRVLGRATRRSG
ncbi:glycosyltransferase family 2 protein [Streptomyces liangshanensis]|uniref:Glycosyltransferase n=1 Tax=Streptomyces liangshanensis TaxID=2717324 RepID=A0A6G9GY33_9ACTN|nr:glycosyltransferase [Streptomyces liangshanensis]QIQ02966.1 glycosyltransferase [Streptomyces liangshanensis]